MKSPLSIIILSSLGSFSLNRAKQSVKFASEVLVVNTGDRKITDFAQVRNNAIKKSKYNWVLFLDSDEVVNLSSVEKIDKIIKKNDCDLVAITRKDIFYSKQLNWGEWGKSKIIRMGKKTHLSFERPVHEVAVVDEDSNVCQSQILIKHYAHRDISSFISKIAYYSFLDAQFRNKNNQNASMFQLLFFPPLKFIYNYFLRLGFLDGWQGFIYASMMSFHSFFIRVFQYES